jgi:hypothetical protein
MFIIDSLSFSFLTGSLIFKELKYATSNQTIKMTKCVIVWKYWLLEPRQVNLGPNLADQDGPVPGSETSKLARESH